LANIYEHAIEFEILSIMDSTTGGGFVAWLYGWTLFRCPWLNCHWNMLSWSCAH